MNIERKHNEQSHTGRLLVLLLLVFLAYSNSFKASWHLDDMTIIIHNPNVHVSSLALEDWSKSIRMPFSGPDREGLNLYRPVAMLTLAVNWFLGETSVFGYHLVNLTIHGLTTALLFFTCLHLLSAPNMAGGSHERDILVAWLAAGLWALHPIQIQAVTYIVQRMASLAALFYLIGILTYIKGRTAETKGKKWAMFGLCLLAFILALGSKQNAVTMPVALILVEVIFFSDTHHLLQSAKFRFLAAGGLISLAMLVGFILWFWPGNPMAGLFDGYHSRPFTLHERLLTEFRVLMMYLFQIIYPIPQQYSIVHPMKLSTSLLNPWTTIPAILGVGLLLGAAVTFIGRFRLAAFAILFFFIGHSIESTFIPLELVFEHRNYLPTLFLFLPVASAFMALMDFYRGRNRIIFVVLAAFVPLFFTGIGLATYTRNSDWATEKSLWLDAVKKAPSLARPYQALALAYENEGRLDEAYKLYEYALTLDDPDPENARFNSLGNMGNILKKQGDYDGAVRVLTKALKNKKGPYANSVRYNLALCLLNTGQEEKALEHIDALLEKQPKSYRYLRIKGFILYLEDDVEGALHYLRLALNQNQHDMNTLLNLGMTLSAMGEYKRSAWYLKRADERQSRNLIIHLSKLQNAIKMQDDKRIRKRLSQIAVLFSIKDIQGIFHRKAQGYHYIDGTLVALNDCLVLPLLVDYFQNKAKGWTLKSGVNNL